MQVALIMSLAGGIRSIEFVNMKVQDVDDLGSMIYIKITGKDAPQSFTITNNSESGYDFLALFRKYASLRPSNANTTRYFLQYAGGKCTTTVVGKNAFGKIPMQISEFLKLTDPKSYTGHCFKATSVSLKIDFLKGLIGYSENNSEEPISKNSQNIISSAKSVIQNNQGQENSLANPILHDTITNLPSTVSVNTKEYSTKQNIADGCISDKIVNDDHENTDMATNEMSSDNDDSVHESCDTIATLSKKTRLLYEAKNKCFVDWCTKHNYTEYTEPVFMEYFVEKAKTCKSSSLWATYSMLRATTIKQLNIDIRNFKKLSTFLKTNSVGVKKEKSKTFTRDEVTKFLIDAPDETYLFLKVYPDFFSVRFC